ncbi:uncharacterized protein BJ212DRAFT_1302736 [Suillus subaureus]|uniref:Uncharacterized protein n=1 Tax=Suillus subaureus TaxID=48587 RepID=A0A9P7J8R8_9AGAM|nr:uncharacterized protein BJ212DRAFT_1302736 [Suillus subaureus]KAG1809175.1 hypothetical protein BJ212DRAFT_1302736 [Suillus subaureus]
MVTLKCAAGVLAGVPDLTLEIMSAFASCLKPMIMCLPVTSKVGPNSEAFRIAKLGPDVCGDIDELDELMRSCDLGLERYWSTLVLRVSDVGDPEASYAVYRIVDLNLYVIAARGEILKKRMKRGGVGLFLNILGVIFTGTSYGKSDDVMIQLPCIIQESKWSSLSIIRKRDVTVSILKRHGVIEDERRKDKFPSRGNIALTLTRAVWEGFSRGCQSYKKCDQVPVGGMFVVLDAVLPLPNLSLDPQRQSPRLTLPGRTTISTFAYTTQPKFDYRLLDTMKIQFTYYLTILAAAGANAALSSTCTYDCLDPDASASCGAGWGPVWDPSLNCKICCANSLE